jgi:hypothetical protein
MTAPGITLSKLVYQGIKGRSSDKAGEVMGVSSNIPEYNAGPALEEEARKRQAHGMTLVNKFTKV